MLLREEKIKGRAGLFLITLALLLFSGIREVSAEEGLVLHFAFDRQGGMVNDLSGKGNNGTLLGSPKSVKGRLGKAAQFAGKEYISCGSDESLSLSKVISIECWAKLDKLEGRQDLVHRPGDYSINWIGNKPVPYLQWCVVTEDGYGIIASNKKDWVTSRWYHLVATYDSSLSNNQSKLYIDGSLDKAIDRTGLIKQTGCSLNLATGPGYPYYGLLDEVRIYSRALGPEEVKEHYQRLSPALPDTGVKLYLFQIDEKGVMLSFPMNQFEEELHKLALKLIISDKGEGVLSEEEIKKINSQNFLYEKEIDISALPKGEFTLRAELRKGKEILAESSFRFSKSGEISTEAEDFSQGNVIATLSGHLGTSLVIRHGSGKDFDFAEYSLNFTMPTEKYKLLVKYAAEEARPVDIYLDGKIVLKEGLKSTTGNWCQSTAQWEEQATLDIHAGKHILKLVGRPHIPVIDAIKFSPAEQK